MLRLKGVTKTFLAGTVNERHALSSVDLEVADGDFCTIVGSNGAGKSTLFNVIAGTLYPDQGYVELDGEDITFMAEHARARRIGRLFQDPLLGTAPHMSIQENLSVAYLRAQRGVGHVFSRISRADKSLFREQLSRLDMGLEDRMGQPVGLLSGGQRQALTLLMATIVVPRVLLLDEHTAALDPATADKVLTLTREIVSERDITCLMITHNMHQALDMGTRTLMMEGGRVILDVSGAERESMGVDDLLAAFAAQAGSEFDNDRVLLSTATE